MLSGRYGWNQLLYLLLKGFRRHGGRYAAHVKEQLTLMQASSTIFVCALLFHVVAVVVPPGVVPES